MLGDELETHRGNGLCGLRQTRPSPRRGHGGFVDDGRLKPATGGLAVDNASRCPPRPPSPTSPTVLHHHEMPPWNPNPAYKGGAASGPAKPVPRRPLDRGACMGALPPPVTACRQVARHRQIRRAVVVPAGAGTIPGPLDGPSESGRVDEETVLALGGRPGAWSGDGMDASHLRLRVPWRSNSPNSLNTANQGGGAPWRGWGLACNGIECQSGRSFVHRLPTDGGPKWIVRPTAWIWPRASCNCTG